MDRLKAVGYALTLEAGLATLNLLPASEAEKEFLKCCGSRQWARRVVSARPFSDVEQLNQAAQQIWWSLGPDEWLEAFHSHPRIGEKKAVAATSSDAQTWSETEQSGTRAAKPDTMQTLARLNQEYDERFGFIFIVCATGKTPEEMLAILRKRLSNDKTVELEIAAGEQAKITRLRLDKLMANLRG